MNESSSNKELWIYRIFRFSLWSKGIFAALEIASALSLWLIPGAWWTRLAIFITRSELAEDPHSLIAHSILRFAEKLSIEPQLFAIIYLVAHGLIKLVLVWVLLKERYNIYPWLMGVIALFICYQMVEFFLHNSLFMLALSLFDSFILYLVWREWRLHKSHVVVLAS